MGRAIPILAPFLFALLVSISLNSVEADDTYIFSWINGLITSSGLCFLDPCINTDPVLAVNNLKPTNLENCEYYINFAYAAYCENTLQNWTCANCIVLGPNVRYLNQVENSILETMAFFAIDDTRREIILTFRGSQNFPNIEEDLVVIPVPLTNDPEVKVHQGFYISQQSLYPGIIEELNNLIVANPDYKVVMNGHSLGGAQAAITIFLFHYNNLFPNTNFELYTYGAPRIGNQAFATYFNKFIKIPVARVTNRADIFPHLPPAFLEYFHTGNEVFSDQGITRNCSNEYYEDLSCSASKGPIYTLLDHFYYFNAELVQCLFDDPINPVIMQFNDLNRLIPTSLSNILQLNDRKLSDKSRSFRALYPFLG